MKKVVLVYHSYRGVSSQMVTSFAEGVRNGGGDPLILQADRAAIEDILPADAIIFGMGQPFGGISGPVKAFLERCWEQRELKVKLKGKPVSFLLVHKRETQMAVQELRTIFSHFGFRSLGDGIMVNFEEAEEGKALCQQAGESLVRSL